MSYCKSTRARGIELSRYIWGLTTTGTREQLTQHGYTNAGPFPGDPGERKTVTETVDPQGREIHIRRSTKYRFTVSRDWSNEETAFYQQAKAKRKEIERATGIVNSWPSSGAEFRRRALLWANASLQSVEAMMTGGSNGGYRYDDDAALRFELLAAQLRHLVESGGIVKDLDLRERYTPACIAKSVKALDRAKEDKGFQRFIAGLSD